jgi:hypothetical protein
MHVMYLFTSNRLVLTIFQLLSVLILVLLVFQVFQLRKRYAKICFKTYFFT